MSVPRRLVYSGTVTLVFLGACISGEVHGQEIPCTEEIRTLCADVQPGGGRILQCLQANEARVSPVCAQRVNDLQQTVSGPLGACRDDWMALCYHSRALPGRQEMVQCLQVYQATLSPGCQKALQGVSGKRQPFRGTSP
jgi:hypothetical protein